MHVGLALSFLRNHDSQQTLDRATVSKNWTTDVQDVVLERKKKQSELCFPNYDIEKWNPKRMQWCWAEETDWRLGFEGTGLCRQGAGEDESWTSLGGLHFVLSQILHAGHTHKSPCGLAVSCYRGWAGSSELSRGSMNNTLVEKII